MKLFRTDLMNSYKLFIYGTLLISAILPALLAVKNIAISPDSMMYALISQEIVSGNGISLPIIYSMKDNYNFINGAVPYIAEPPFLPIVLALFGGVTSKSYLAAQIVNVISHVVISIFSFLLMKKIYGNDGIALLTGILVAVSFPLVYFTHYILSEPLCIALMVASVYFLILTRHADRDLSIRYLLIASICTSAAILTRFASIALIPLFFWGAFIAAQNNKIKLIKISTIVIIALPLITTGALFLIAYIISGSIRGWEAPLPDRSYLDAFTGTIEMLFLQFDLGERFVTPLIIFSFLFILYLVLNTSTRRTLSNYFHSGLDLIIVFIASYTFLVSYAMATAQTVFEVRFMSPLVPFLLIVAILLTMVFWEMIRVNGFSKLSLCGIILSLCILIFGNFYKTYVNSEVLFSKRMGHYRILNSPTYKWIKENYGDNAFITTNRPYHLSFLGGYSTIRMPHRRFNENYRIPDNMESFLPARMSKFESKVLALFGEAEEQYEGSYVARLFNKRDDDDNFVLLHSFSDGVVYKLKE